jgi:hypothetical protein
MAKVNFSSMPVEALLKLRDEIGDVLSRKAGQLQSKAQNEQKISA